MAKVPTSIETLPKISSGCVGSTNVTGRQTTNRQTTDGLSTAHRERECEFTFAKNFNNVTIIISSGQSNLA